jgi:N-dimethylarginine dimethylaminohydrolase
MRLPSDGLKAVAELGDRAWHDAVGAYVDPGRRWYWAGRQLPDLERLAAEFDQFIATVRAQGVEVVLAGDMGPRFTKAVFTRDPLFTIPGGSIVGRMAARMRRGEEQDITRTVAALGAPILGTIAGTGLAEGGSFVKVRPDRAFFGTSVRCNAEGYRQLSRLLADHGIELTRVSMPGYQIHLDLCCAMVDDDLALVNPQIAPYDFLTELWALGVETVDVEPHEDWACNVLALDRRKLLFPAHLPRTAEKLNARHGVEIVPVEFREINKNGGGIHCSTHELVRDW